MTLLERLGGRETVTRGIVDTFRAISRPPHPSGQEGAAADAVAALLSGLGLGTERDGAGNLLCRVPAAPGREGAPELVLQGHLDMVCAAAPGSGWNPQTDPVTVVEADGFLRSDGRSSLGADNNLGNAAVLWLLASGKLRHGPLRLLFTTAEEVGLEGAKQVSPAWLAGAGYLLNTDGFHLGRAIVGSAGGRRERWRAPPGHRPRPGCARLAHHPVRRPGGPLGGRHQQGPGQPHQAAGRPPGRPARRADGVAGGGRRLQRHPRLGPGGGAVQKRP